MNSFIYEYVYSVPFVTFTDKPIRGGGGLPRTLFTSLMRAKIITNYKRRVVTSPFHFVDEESYQFCILNYRFQQQRGNLYGATHHRSARTLSMQKYITRNIYIIMIYTKKNGPPPYCTSATGMIGFA